MGWKVFFQEFFLFWLGLFSSDGEQASMSKCMTWVAVINVVIIIQIAIWTKYNPGIDVLSLAVMLFIFALINRADSRRVSLKWAGMEFSQDLEVKQE